MLLAKLLDGLKGGKLLDGLKGGNFSENGTYIYCGSIKKNRKQNILSSMGLKICICYI